MFSVTDSAVARTTQAARGTMGMATAVHEALQQGVDLAPQIRADHAEQSADRAAGERGGEADEERDLDSSEAGTGTSA
jgi:hypothetical protein